MLFVRLRIEAGKRSNIVLPCRLEYHVLSAFFHFIDAYDRVYGQKYSAGVAKFIFQPLFRRVDDHRCVLIEQQMADLDEPKQIALADGFGVKTVYFSLIVERYSEYTHVVFRNDDLNAHYNRNVIKEPLIES